MTEPASRERCCPGDGSMAHVRACKNHPEYYPGINRPSKARVGPAWENPSPVATPVGHALCALIRANAARDADQKDRLAKAPGRKV